jgi:hypothetical protein
LYFVSFAAVYWIDVFIRDTYCYTTVESLDFCRKNKGMEIFSWCIMSNHIHLIYGAKKIILLMLDLYQNRIAGNTAVLLITVGGKVYYRWIFYEYYITSYKLAPASGLRYD